MARQIANVDIQTDTFGSWISRTNQIVNALSSEVMTANSTSGVTGSIASPRNATLFGKFSSNSVFSSNTFQVANSIFANTTTFTFGSNTRIIANNKIGLSGQILTVGDSGALYFTYAGTGTVTRVTGGNGLTGTVTSSGSLTVKEGDGINVSASGVSVDPAYIATLTAANTAKLNSKTWASPDPIGSSTPNTGKFTSLTGTDVHATSYSITGNISFLLNEQMFNTPGYIESITPATGTKGGINLRSSNGGTAKLVVTDYLSTKVYGTVAVDSSGKWSWSNSASFAGTINAASSSLSGNLTVSTSNALGGGITLSDVGDISDLNDGFASMRFTNGVKIYSANKGGTPAITFNTDGTIVTGANKKYIKEDDFTRYISGNFFGSRGYTKLPNGLIIQWGATGYLGQEGDVTVSFPIAFPTACLTAVATLQSPSLNNTANDMWAKIYTATTTTITINYGSSSGGNYGQGSYWIAIGY